MCICWWYVMYCHAWMSCVHLYTYMCMKTTVHRHKCVCACIYVYIYIYLQYIYAYIHRKAHMNMLMEYSCYNLTRKIIILLSEVLSEEESLFFSSFGRVPVSNYFHIWAMYVNLISWVLCINKQLCVNSLVSTTCRITFGMVHFACSGAQTFLV
jgi:hypothetical protein